MAFERLGVARVVGAAGSVAGMPDRGGPVVFLEDCAVLDECIGRLGPDWSRVLPEYTGRRKENGDAIADLALRNFIEMRDHVASVWFLLKKRLDKLLHRLLPGIYKSLYSMISFSNIPYAEAVRKSFVQAQVLRGICILILLVLLMIIARQL